MRIIVTGGAGRLGRSVATELASAGHHVVSVDRTDPGLAGVEGRVADLLDHDATHELFASLRPEAVVHLAAIAVPFSAPEPVILSTNQSLAFTALTAGIAAGASRLLAASSPTVIGYGAPGGWTPTALPITEEHPTAPWNAYALSKVAIESTVSMLARAHGADVVISAFRPCFVVSPEEWEGAPTQQGHTIVDRLADPALAAVSLYNYLDARDAGRFVTAWLDHAEARHSGEVYFVGADDALALAPLSDLLPALVPSTAGFADDLTDHEAAFSSAKAKDAFGWQPLHHWPSALSPTEFARLRDVLAASDTASISTPR
ncbi:MAG TPA: NAD(P)-dependent oxidoreductase [Plantibacter sp.]|uniref:NAD-dependent epimerase/dehydratase family protein n=1 Tax=unclassified Plantibacter TaxID=2624265 RepID=UPI002CFFD982|nr:NAD(P)-dependent oxidoreductase [Plantibacter sp.]